MVRCAAIINEGQWQINQVAICFCRYDIAKFSTQLFAQHDIDFPETIQQSVLKRQAEFFFGRHIARKSLKALNIMQADIPIGKDRNPIWPANTIGSISHTDSIVIACSQYLFTKQYLGIDIEKVFDSKTYKEIKPFIINHNEAALLSSWQLPDKTGLTLAFSAKESLFKAIYPYLEYYLNFSDSNIIYVNDRVVILAVSNELAVQLNQQYFRCDYRLVGQYIVTLITA